MMMFVAAEIAIKSLEHSFFGGECHKETNKQNWNCHLPRASETLFLIYKGKAGERETRQTPRVRGPA